MNSNINYSFANIKARTLLKPKANLSEYHDNFNGWQNANQTSNKMFDHLN